MITQLLDADTAWIAQAGPELKISPVAPAESSVVPILHVKELEEALNICRQSNLALVEENQRLHDLLNPPAA
jgi:hypothetical protein